MKEKEIKQKMINLRMAEMISKKTIEGWKNDILICQDETTKSSYQARIDGADFVLSLFKVAITGKICLKEN